MPRRKSPDDDQARRIEALWRTYRPELLRMLLKRLGNSPARSEAEDMMQEAFRRLIKYRHNLHGVENLRPYAVTTVLNVCKKWKRVELAPAEAPEPDEIAADRAENQQTDVVDELIIVEHMELAMSQMPAHEQAILRLCARGYSSREIAGMLDITFNKARRRLTDARAHLKSLLSAVTQGRVRK